ncbi:MAG: response regulator transcription factor [Phycisphaerae bacterium]|nr:response regulator transcription factor [Phycisphaerae bacterium]
MAIKIILADDHTVIRAGIRSLLDKCPNIVVIAEASDGRETVEKAAQLKPDIIIMDIAMPNLNGVEATRKIKADNSRVKILALSMHADKRYIIETLKAGASGYILKNCAVKELTDAINTINNNQTYLSPSIAEVVLDELLNDNTDVKNNSVLTAREKEVLQLISEGKSTKKIAMELHISVSTIETHRRQAMEKLNIHSIAELTKYAIREGLTTLEG